MSSILLSDQYRQQQETLHENPNYGVASIEFADTVARIVNEHGVTKLLDYGAGKCRLMQTISEKRLVDHPFQYIPYDPGVPRFAETPEPAEFVCCIDVLEHVEPEYLDNVLNDLERVTEVMGFFTVHCGPAAKTLPDGRNAHLIQMPPSWWLSKIMDRFELQNFARTENGFVVVVMARGINTWQ